MKEMPIQSNERMPVGFQTVVEHFKRNEWNFQISPDRPLIHASFRGKNGSFRCIAVVDDSDDLFQVLGFLPLVVPDHKRAIAAELCTRLSYGMKIGRFELDHEDGELRFHTCSAYASGGLTDEVVRRVLGVNLVMVDHHFPAFIKVIYGTASPAEAADHIRALISKGESSPSESESQLESSLRVKFN